MSARIVILSGSPGTGKTTVSRILAENSAYKKAVHIELDDFWQYIRKGYIAPWLNDSGGQNETVVEAVAASAKIYAKNGYEVFVSGAIGPWFIKPWLKIAKKGVDVRFVVLRPDKKTAVERVIKRQWQDAAYDSIEDFRQESDYFPLTYEVIKDLWDSFNDFGIYEPHVVDTTGQTVGESVAILQKMLAEDAFRIFKGSKS
ncbi:MAG: zeta toxin family protein [Oscillospiraceae bacterium]|nr:zeta toxin family protein [Oscillospiraceae bacterium]